MIKKSFAVKHRISNAIRWYGSEFEILRKTVNDYGEPVEEPITVCKFNGIYHESQQSFLDLLNIEAAQVKIKTNKGVLAMVGVYSNKDGTNFINHIGILKLPKRKKCQGLDGIGIFRRLPKGLKRTL